VTYSSLAIANEFLKRAEKTGANLTHMQLQKLVYLAHGWNLAVNGEPLVEDDVEAWDYGTVFRKLYDALKIYGGRPITSRLKWGDDTPFGYEGATEACVDLDTKEKDVVDKVWELYGSFPAFKLSALTHADDGPWRKNFQAGRNKVIPEGEICEYFVRLGSGH